MPGAQLFQPGTKIEVVEPNGAEVMTQEVQEVEEAEACFKRILTSILREFHLPHFSLSVAWYITREDTATVSVKGILKKCEGQVFKWKQKMLARGQDTCLICLQPSKPNNFHPAENCRRCEPFVLCTDCSVRLPGSIDEDAVCLDCLEPSEIQNLSERQKFRHSVLLPPDRELPTLVEVARFSVPMASSSHLDSRRERSVRRTWRDSLGRIPEE